MSKRRPANMFQYPQETELSPMRDKLLFIEALAASDDLTGRELRVAILLTSFYSTSNGYAKPIMVCIAAALRLDKSNVAKAIKKTRRPRLVHRRTRQFQIGRRSSAAGTR